MRKKILLQFLLFTFFNSSAQKIIVVDSLKKEPISFVAIKSNNDGFYSNEFGEFNLKQATGDTLDFYILGYKNLRLTKKEIKDTIILKSNLTLLDEVILSKNNIIKEIKFLKKARNYGSWPLHYNSEIITNIYPKDIISGYYIETLNIPFGKQYVKNKLKDKETKTFVRVNIFKLLNDSPSIKIYSSLPIEISSYFKDKIEIDLSNELITLDKEGLSISIEALGHYKGGEVLDSKAPNIRPILTKKKNDFYISKTFLKFLSKKQAKYQSMNEILNQLSSSNEKIDRNLSIGLVLIK